MQTTVCLIRHGETAWNHLGIMQGQIDTELNETGKNQARLTAAWLSRATWEGVIASPLKRAMQTAEIIANYLQIPTIEPIPAFIERHHGQASGLDAQQRQELFPDGDVPDIESFAALQARVLRGLDSLPARYPNQSIIAVTHGDVISAILSAISTSEMIGPIYNASVTLLHFAADSWTVACHNDISHLAP